MRLCQQCQRYGTPPTGCDCLGCDSYGAVTASSAPPLFQRFPLRAENLRRNLTRPREVAHRRREQLDAVRLELYGWAQWRAGYWAGKGELDGDLEETDRAAAIATPGDAVRFYLETVGGAGWAELPIRERWRKLHRLYRESFRSGWAAEDFGPLRRRMMGLLIGEGGGL